MRPKLNRPLFLAMLAIIAPAAFAQAPQEPAPPVEEAPAPRKPAETRLTDVTVYQGTALISREVKVPEGQGLVEVVVTPLPHQAIPSSLYSEGGDGLRVLSTRYRARAVREDTRAAVREKEEELKKLQTEARKLQAVSEVVKQDREYLQKLEGFTAAVAKSLNEQGRFESDQVTNLSDYLMKSRAEKAEAATKIEGLIQANAESLAFAQRQLAELSGGSSKTAIDAVILVDKAEAPAGTITLNYLVNGATWRPQYRLRAGGESDPVQLEYLAAISQQSGEDWTGVKIVLSTAQPALNAAPPDLTPLAISVRPEDGGPTIVNNPAAGKPGMGGMGGGMGGMGMMSGGPGGAPAKGGLSMEQYAAQAKSYRGAAQTVLNRNDLRTGGELLNSAAAFDQARELLAKDDDDKGEPAADGPTVTFGLPSKMDVPSRRDALMVEVKRIELPADFYDKAVPVLTPRVYRLANLVNKSDTVLLPGEATTYVGTDFVGRMTMPMVAVGEPFTVGFGVDPQVQIFRRLMTKSKAVQGGNQVHTYEFRISARSFRAKPVPLQVWDRLPKAADEDVAVNLVQATPKLSEDSVYKRNAAKDNLLRWDLTLAPTKPGADPETILYQFRMEFAREMTIDQIASGALAEAPIGTQGGGMGGGFRQVPAEVAPSKP
ncbi:MAG: mucoidy inhibitor MuiA family protein [Isosphaeraceae bacterium]